MKYRIIALVLSLVMLLSFSLSVYAEGSTEQVTDAWTENEEMYNEINKHFQIWTVQAVASGIATLVSGGTASAFTVLASGLVANAICTETHNVYFKIYYYWQPSDDPQYPFYIMQITEAYTDIERTDFVGSKTRYYYSTTTF